VATCRSSFYSFLCLVCSSRQQSAYTMWRLAVCVCGQKKLSNVFFQWIFTLQFWVNLQNNCDALSKQTYVASFEQLCSHANVNRIIFHAYLCRYPKLLTKFKWQAESAISLRWLGPCFSCTGSHTDYTDSPSYYGLNHAVVCFRKCLYLVGVTAYQTSTRGTVTRQPPTCAHISTGLGLHRYQHSAHKLENGLI
jgi:hypothetical protein